MADNTVDGNCLEICCYSGIFRKFAQVFSSNSFANNTRKFLINHRRSARKYEEHYELTIFENPYQQEG